MATRVTPIKQKPDGLLQHLNAFLDKRILPYPIKFLTNRVIILATLTLLVPLIFLTADQAFVNVVNSYLNVMSVVVSSTVLLYATIADVRDKAAAKRARKIARAYQQLLEERVLGREEIAKVYEQVLEKRVLEREEIAKVYEQVLEKRVQADHELIEQILQTSVQNILVERLEKVRVEDHKKLEEMQQVVIASNEALRKELAEKSLIASNESLRAELAALAALVHKLDDKHFGPDLR